MKYVLFTALIIMTLSAAPTPEQLRDLTRTPSPTTIRKEIQDELAKPSPNYGRIIALNNTLLSNKVYIFKYDAYYTIANCHLAQTNFSAAESNFQHSFNFDFRKTEGYEILKANPTMLEINRMDIFYNFYNVKRADIAIAYMRFLDRTISNRAKALAVADRYLTNLLQEPIPPLFKSMENTPAYQRITNERARLAAY